MSYYTYIMFPAEKVNEETNITLYMSFRTNHPTDNANRYYMDPVNELGLRVLSYGTHEISYDLQDRLLTPSTQKLVLGDPNGFIDNLFFGQSFDSLATIKAARVTIMVNNDARFIGYCVEEGIESDSDNLTVSITAKPQIESLSKQMLYKDVYAEDGSVSTVALNPFGYTDSTFYSLKSLLLKLYQLAEPVLVQDDIKITHDWEFQGRRSANYIYLNDIKVEELSLLSNNFFFNPLSSLKTCADILRQLAVEFCAFTGLLTDHKAFFKKLFHYNPANLQTVNVYSHKKGYGFGTLDFVRVKTKMTPTSTNMRVYDEGYDSQLGDRVLDINSLIGCYVSGANTGTNLRATCNRSGYVVFDHVVEITPYPSEGSVYSTNGSEYTVVGTPYAEQVTPKLTTKRTSGVTLPAASGTLTRVSGTGPETLTFNSWGNASAEGTAYYEVNQARDNSFNSGMLDHGDLVAKFWFNNRAVLNKCRVDKFVFKGLNYDYLKDFNYNNGKYQPITMKFDYSKSSTYCEAIYLGDL